MEIASKKNKVQWHLLNDEALDIFTCIVFVPLFLFMEQFGYPGSFESHYFF